MTFSVGDIVRWDPRIARPPFEEAYPLSERMEVLIVTRHGHLTVRRDDGLQELHSTVMFIRDEFLTAAHRALRNAKI